MTCHLFSCYVMSCHPDSCHVTSRYVTPPRDISSCITPCHVMSCHVTSRHVTSRHVTSRHDVMSCHVRSCVYHGDPTRQPVPSYKYYQRGSHSWTTYTAPNAAPATRKRVAPPPYCHKYGQPRSPIAALQLDHHHHFVVRVRQPLQRRVPPARANTERPASQPGTQCPSHVLPDRHCHELELEAHRQHLEAASLISLRVHGSFHQRSAISQRTPHLLRGAHINIKFDHCVNVPGHYLNSTCSLQRPFSPSTDWRLNVERPLGMFLILLNILLIPSLMGYHSSHQLLLTLHYQQTTSRSAEFFEPVECEWMEVMAVGLEVVHTALTSKSVRRKSPQPHFPKLLRPRKTLFLHASKRPGRATAKRVIDKARKAKAERNHVSRPAKGGSWTKLPALWRSACLGWPSSSALLGPLIAILHVLMDIREV